MIFKQNLVVVLTHGRLAGKKAVVLALLENDHLLVGGINRVPYTVGEEAVKWEKLKSEKFLTFIKKVNIKHVIATRYSAEIDTKGINTSADISDLAVKVDMNKRMNSVLHKLHKEEKCKFLFNELSITK